MVKWSPQFKSSYKIVFLGDENFEDLLSLQLQTYYAVLFTVT